MDSIRAHPLSGTNGAPMRAPLSPADDQVVGLLGAHRVLTTHQVAAATAVPQRTAEYRLDRLRQRGLVERSRPYLDRGSAPYHWWLTRTGLGVAHRTPPGRTRTLEPNPLFLGHATATAGFALALQARGPEVGLILGEWLRDEDGWEEWRAEGRTWRVTPDGMVAATAHGETVRAFVEIDLGTMTQRRLRDKMLRYLRYAHDERWRDRHPHCPAVLVVTTSDERAERLLAGVEILRRRQRRRSTIWWAASDTATTLAVAACGLVGDPDSAVTAPVWRQSATDVLSTLADVLSAHATTCAQREADEAAERARVAQAEYDKDQPNTSTHSASAATAFATRSMTHASATRSITSSPDPEWPTIPSPAPLANGGTRAVTARPIPARHPTTPRRSCSRSTESCGVNRPNSSGTWPTLRARRAAGRSSSPLATWPKAGSSTWGRVTGSDRRPASTNRRPWPPTTHGGHGPSSPSDATSTSGNALAPNERSPPPTTTSTYGPATPAVQRFPTLNNRNTAGAGARPVAQRWCVGPNARPSPRSPSPSDAST